MGDLDAESKATGLGNCRENRGEKDDSHKNIKALFSVFEKETSDWKSSSQQSQNEVAKGYSDLSRNQRAQRAKEETNENPPCCIGQLEINQWIVLGFRENELEEVRGAQVDVPSQSATDSQEKCMEVGIS